MNQHDIGRQFDYDIKQTVWPALGVNVLKEYTTKLEQRKFGDYMIRVDNQIKNVDIKAEKDMPPNFPIELLQDWQSFDIGWYYTLLGCDEIWYGRYSNLLEVYRVSLKRLRNSNKNWKALASYRGHGGTVFIQAPIEQMIENKICVKVWPNEE